MSTGAFGLDPSQTLAASQGADKWGKMPSGHVSSPHTCTQTGSLPPLASLIPVLIAASAGARNTKQTMGRNSESEGHSTGSEQGTNLNSKKNYLWLFI